MNRIVRTLLCAVGLIAPVAYGQLTTVTGSGLRVGSSPITTGTVCAVATDSNDNPITVQVGGGGLWGAGQICANISAGAITTAVGGGTYQVPDEALAGNAGFLYRFTVTNTANNQGFIFTRVPSVTGTTWSLSSYFPTTSIPTTGVFTFTSGSGIPSGTCSGKSFYQDNSTPSIPVLYSCGADNHYHTVAGTGTYTSPTGTGFNHTTGGTLDGTARAVVLNSADVSGVLPAANVTPMGASGGSHSAGIVPDPGASAGTTHYLREDGTWQVPASSGSGTPGGSPNQIQWDNAGSFGGFTVSGDATLVPSTGLLTLVNTAVTPGSYTAANITIDSKGRITAATNGSGTGSSPSSTGVPYYTVGTGWSVATPAQVSAGLVDPTKNSSITGQQATGGSDAGIPAPTASEAILAFKAGIWQESVNGDAFSPLMRRSDYSPVALTDGATVTYAEGGINGAMATLTLVHTTTTRTLNVTGLVANSSFNLILNEDSTGVAGTFNLGTGCTWKLGGSLGFTAASTLTLTSTANATNVASVLYDGTNCLVNLR